MSTPDVKQKKEWNRKYGGLSVDMCGCFLLIIGYMIVHKIFFSNCGLVGSEDVSV